MRSNPKKRDSLVVILDTRDKDSERVLRIILGKITRNGGFGMEKAQMEDLSENIKVEVFKNSQ